MEKGYLAINLRHLSCSTRLLYTKGTRRFLIVACTLHVHDSTSRGKQKEDVPHCSGQDVGSSYSIACFNFKKFLVKNRKYHTFFINNRERNNENAILHLEEFQQNFTLAALYNLHTIFYSSVRILFYKNQDWIIILAQDTPITQYYANL